MADAADSKPVNCGFDSHPGYNKKKVPVSLMDGCMQIH